MKIALGTDHAGFAFKERVKAFLPTLGHEVVDFGTHDEESCDYPDFVIPAASAVARGECWTVEAARLNRAHNDGNVLSIGGRLVPETDLLDIVRTWLATPFDGGRHAARIAKLADLGTPADAGLAAFFPAR